MEYNEEHGITPQQIKKEIQDGGLAAMRQQAFDAVKQTASKSAFQKSGSKPIPYIEPSERKYLLPEERTAVVADPISRSMSVDELRKSIKNTTSLMKEAAKNLDFIQAAQYRDELINLQNLLDSMEEKEI